MIKFWSYLPEYNFDREKILKNIDETLKSGHIFFGKELAKFEKNFLKSNNSKYGAGVKSGTDALLLSLRAINIKKNDEIITAANTAIPTISAIISAGGIPKLVDINKDYLIDVTKIEAEITSKTKAIIPVHLYGQSCDMDKIISIAKKYNIKIIEDCAQSQGAKYKDKYVGNFGDFGCFSFYPTKILGAYGDGGFITVKKKKYYEKIKRLRFYGIETINNKNKFYRKYFAIENGYNSRLDEIQSSILNLKLKKIKKNINRRIFLAKIYIKYLKNTNLILPNANKNNRHVYHLFTVYHPKKKLIIKKLKKLKIETREIYPYPIQAMTAYKKIINNHNRLLNSQIKSKGIFSLPLYPELNKNKVIFICKKLIDICKNL